MSRQRVINILRGPEASRIRFTFPSDSGTITVTPRTFLRVARAIQGGQVAVTVVPEFGPGRGQYTQPNNIRVARIIGRLDEGAVMHEALHAFFDLEETDISALDEEAAGFVVDALYFRMTGLPQRRWNSNQSELAGLVATGLLNDYAAGTSSVPAVGLVTWNLLRAGLLLDPHYGPTVRDGSFPHDG